MVILFAIFVLICVPTLYISTYLDDKKGAKTGKKTSRCFYAWIILVVIATSFLAGIPIVQNSQAIGKAEEVATFQDARLFYDAEKNEYFTVTLNNWDIVNIIEKRNVDNDTAIKVLNDIEQAKALTAQTQKFYD